VIIDDFNVIGSILLPYKTNTKLIVDADAVLTPPLSFQWFQHVSRRLPEIVQTGSCIHPVEFSPSHDFYGAPSPICADLSQFRSVVVLEAPDHGDRIGCNAFNVKR
jgi:hypothetical protein